jgi:hypothetical protein
MNHTKPNGEGKNIFVSVLIVVLFVGAIVVYANYYKSNLVETPIKEDVATIDEEEPALFNCGLLVKSPIKKSKCKLSKRSRCERNLGQHKSADTWMLLDIVRSASRSCVYSRYKWQKYCQASTTRYN